MVYTIEQLKERIVLVALKYGLPAVYIFGSYAMGGLYNDLSEAVGKPIDLVTTGGIGAGKYKRTDAVVCRECEQCKGEDLSIIHIGELGALRRTFR